jgi:ankyrin repeat protein
MTTDIRWNEFKYPLALSELNSDVDATHGVCGLTKIQRSIAYNESYFMCAHLLSHGANSNGRSMVGEPNLHTAVRCCNEQITALLLEQGADRTALYQGRSALEYAKMLLECENTSDEARNLRLIIWRLSN